MLQCLFGPRTPGVFSLVQIISNADLANASHRQRFYAMHHDQTCSPTDEHYEYRDVGNEGRSVLDQKLGPNNHHERAVADGAPELTWSQSESCQPLRKQSVSDSHEKVGPARDARVVWRDGI